MSATPPPVPRALRALHPALRDDIADLTTRRPLPGPGLADLDPFLFLNHHGPQTYAPDNHGLPFGPHPHRGFETVTFILEGSLAHRDSGGHESIIEAGGVQWMTAGSGLTHAELSPDAFKRNGGPLEILQLWVNLPARLKMTKPRYVGLQGNEIPSFEKDKGRVRVALVSGEAWGHTGAIPTLTDITMMTLTMAPGGSIDLPVATGRRVFLYVVRGALRNADGAFLPAHHLAGLDDAAGDSVAFTAEQPATVLLGHAWPFGEPIVSHGPFVMNTREEIRQAVLDYQAGRFA
jgi:quercetin 2,3-dioxygenase